MKKILAAMILLATASTAQAGYRCEPTYYQAWDSYNQTYYMARGRDRCYQTYEPDYYVSGPRPGYSGEEVLLGGLLGLGLGYAWGNSNHHHHNYYRRPYYGH